MLLELCSKVYTKRPENVHNQNLVTFCPWGHFIVNYGPMDNMKVYRKNAFFLTMFFNESFCMLALSIILLKIKNNEGDSRQL